MEGINQFEAFLARQYSPVLMGKKPASLSPQPNWWDERRAEQLGCYGLRCAVIPRGERRGMVIVYRADLLAVALREGRAERVLRGLGYPTDSSVEDNLFVLARKVCDAREFPHEIGFFLGYPPDDVLGFMRHKGRNCKLCGVWKVYGDEARARRLFAEYASCTQYLLECLRDGGSLLERMTYCAAS